MRTNNIFQYTLEDLINLFREKGMNISPSWIYRQEAKGRLACPRSTTNFKGIAGENLGAVRVFTYIQLNEIVNAFLPNGKGKWHFKKGGD